MPKLMLVPDVEAPDYPFAAVWDLMVSALRFRNVPRQDAEDASQQALMTLVADPPRFAPMLADLNTYHAFFARMALNEYLMKLRSESRRRKREALHVQSTSRLTGGEDGPDVDDALALMETAPLNDRQREYLHAVLVEHVSVDELAQRTRTTPRAVRAVLQRAVRMLHEPHPEAA